MNSFNTANLTKEFIAIKNKCIIAAVLIMFLFTSCTLMPVEEEVLAPPVKEPQKVEYETIEVKKGTIEKKIRCTGYFVSVATEDVFFSL